MTTLLLAVQLLFWGHLSQIGGSSSPFLASVPVTEGNDILRPERYVAKDGGGSAYNREDLSGDGSIRENLPIEPIEEEMDDIVLTEEQKEVLAQLNGARNIFTQLPKWSQLQAVLTPQQMEAFESRKAVSSVTYHWPDVNGFPYVPFTFEDDLVNRTAVLQAIQHWRNNTCITFTEVPTSTTGPRIRFKRHASACSSYVGMFNWQTGQPMNVADRCEESFGSLVHEIGHAIGFWHEQSRSDRDNYVVIKTQNILTGMEHNFDLGNDNNWTVPYDYNSIMHYSARAFSKTDNYTIVTLDPRYQNVIGQRNGLSHMDKLLANTMYGCTGKLLVTCSLSSDPCLNYGYLGTDCNCVCPDGTTGTFCETVNTPYNDIFISPNSEIITSPKTVQTVNYPSVFPMYSDFAKWIKAPTCQRVKLTFATFDIYHAKTMKVDGKYTEVCYYDGLEIRTSDMTQGEWYCGQQIIANQVFYSVGREMILVFKSRTHFKQGFSANVTFEVDPSCTIITGTSTSTSTTTTSTSTTTTTTPSPPGQCGVNTIGSVTNFTSPDFPGYYPNNAWCTLSELTNNLVWVKMYVRILKLRPGDFLEIRNPYEPPRRLSGSIFHKEIVIPSAQFLATFRSNKVGTWKGFHVEFSLRCSYCSQKLSAAPGGAITSPNYPRRHPRRSRCEWHITASPGKLVQISFTAMKVGYFRHNYIIVNPTSSLYYSSSVQVVNGFTLPSTITSDLSRMRIFFSGGRRTRGFRLEYSEVNYQWHSSS